MEGAELTYVVGGSVISLLLAIVAYFLREVHRELKEMRVGWQILSERLAVSEVKGRKGHEQINERLNGHGQRLTRLEDKVL